MQISQQKTPTTFMPLHPKFHMRRNPLKRLPDLNSQNNNSNGYDFHKPIKGPPIFKRSNPLFVVNSLFGNLLLIQISSNKMHIQIRILIIRRKPITKTKNLATAINSASLMLKALKYKEVQDS